MIGNLSSSTFPDNAMIYVGITVDEDIPKGDDPLMFADLRGGSWIGPG
jgi:hypothetical protein